MRNGRRRRLKTGAGEGRRRRREAAPLVVGILVDTGKPTGAASTGWLWRMLVDSVEVLGSGWLVCGMGRGWCIGEGGRRLGDLAGVAKRVRGYLT